MRILTLKWAPILPSGAWGLRRAIAALETCQFPSDLPENTP